MSSRSEKKRAQILEAAGQLFNEQGYGVSMDSVAKLANVSKQTVYAHFKTKDILFETCIQSKCVANQIDENSFNADAPLRQALVGFGIRFQEMLMEPVVHQTFRNAVSQLETHPQLAEIYLQSGPKRTTQVLGEFLELKQQKGELKLTLSAEDSAMQLLLMFHGRAVYWGLLGGDSKESEAQRHAYIDDCVDLFLARNT
ncbi:transcriptional regulator, tetR family [Vibrio ishigakensis]|uniref:Transcriptional regulator, tetR family n=1 Tax=Vibrio ishigakensis TaxID=1481914 RepID=A0A0B8P052_9VIBR|nr:TetR/AcrR family transcriptional regulator [Vibrio ishigakensis]GAM56698.1 transcriptional regulator, tetR family [Vibrio ishigakensis]